MAQGGLTTRYIYDTVGRLRFTISPEGRVTENKYINGQLTSSLQYTGATYSSSALVTTARNFESNAGDISYTAGVTLAKDASNNGVLKFTSTQSATTSYPTAASAATGELSQAAIRARVESNLAESAAARASSNFNLTKVGLPAREWPPFPGSVNQIENDFVLLPGAKIDRFGPPQGTFLSPIGTSYSARALKPGTMADDYYVYEVLRPLPVKAGDVRSWFSESGGGMQYRLDAINGVRRSPSTLTAGDNPYLKEVFKGKYGAYE